MHAGFTRCRGTILDAIAIALFALLLANCRGLPADRAIHTLSSSDFAPTPASTPTPIHGPRIALEHSEIDLGPISDDRPVPYTIRFWNVGDEPLVVRKISGPWNRYYPIEDWPITRLSPAKPSPASEDPSPSPTDRRESPRINP